MRSLVTTLLVTTWPVSLFAQALPDLTQRMLGMTAVTGFEQQMADTLLQLLPGAERDRAGNVIVVLGSGPPIRAAVCPMDEWGFVIGHLRPDGYATLRRVGRGAPPTFDRVHEGHRVTVWGSAGPVPAVVGVPSVHLRRGRQGGAGGSERSFTVDDAVVDFGATSDADVRRRGVDVMSPVALFKQPHAYGDGLLAGPEAGQRGACAALVSAYLRRPDVDGTVITGFVVESRLGHRGVRTVANARGPFTGTLLLDYPELDPTPGTLGSVDRLRVPTRYEGWPVETVAMGDVELLAGQILEWMRRAPTASQREGGPWR